MKEDDRIQQQIENAIIPDGIDAEAYRLVFQALKKETSAKLPDGFATRVAALAFAKKKSFDWDKFFLFIGLSVFTIAAGYAIVATDFTFSVGSFRFLSNYPYFVLFAVAVVALLQWIDKKILKTTTTQF